LCIICLPNAIACLALKKAGCGNTAGFFMHPIDLL